MNKNLYLSILFASIVLITVIASNDSINKSNKLNSSPCSINFPIDTISWGKIEVKDINGETQIFKDCQLYPGVVKNWNWKETGTQHVPGIDKADFKEFVDLVDIVILSRGMDCILQTKSETIDYLKSINKEFYIKETREAVELYNNLIKEGKRVGALIHSTC